MSVIVSGCPFDHEQHTTGYEQMPAPEGMMSSAELRAYMFDWYQKTGMRGCVFNKVAARDARKGDFAWETPVEYASIDEITDGKAGARILRNFESIIGDGSNEGLVSYMFPGITEPQELGRLLKFLLEHDPGRFMVREVVDRSTMPGFGDEEFLGIPFRIKVGDTQAGEDATAYPMIYAPWQFTTFARRFDVPKITFNRFNQKENPETPDTFIGVDDVNLRLTPETFGKMFDRSIAVNGIAHTVTGKPGDEYQYSRRLFRAYNALVLPANAWETV